MNKGKHLSLWSVSTRVLIKKDQGVTSGNKEGLKWGMVLLPHRLWDVSGR